MKLYRIQSKAGNMVTRTVFRTSQKDAKTAARHMTGDVVIDPVKLPHHLTQQNWIDLLESDSPGDQDCHTTPVDFIEHS